MNGQPIPGYYWDAEKKKYFKIQSRGASQGSNFKYSIDNIRKEERKERIQKVATARANKVRKERVVRRNPNNTLQTNIEREIGFRRPSFYLHSLWTDACAFGIDVRPRKVVNSRSSKASIRAFDVDGASQTTYAVQASNLVIQIDTEEDPPGMGPHSSDHYELPALYEYQNLIRTTSTVSSITHMPATGALAVTTYGSDRPPEVWLTDPERDPAYVGQKFTPKDCNTIWAAAARPSTFTPSPGLANSVAANYAEHLAVAASRSMLLFTRAEWGSWDSKVALKDLPSDVLALDWISYTTVSLGCRDGSIRLYDTRSGGSSHILTHPYPVSKLKRADSDTRLICSGLQDTLSLYDIRSPGLSSSSSSFSSSWKSSSHYDNDYFKQQYPGNRDSHKRRKLSRKAVREWSQPLLTFAHANCDELELDIDVHPRLGLIAAAQDVSTGTAIRVSNMWTGKTVREIKCEGERNGKTGSWESIRSVKFVDKKEGGFGAGVELWSGWDGGIAKFNL